MGLESVRPYKKVLRLSRGGRNRLRKGYQDERITGSIRLSEYISWKASSNDSPTNQLKVLSETPTPTNSKTALATTVLLDTGASISLLPLWKAKELGVDIKEKSNIRVRGADGRLLQIMGTGFLWMRDQDSTFWKRVTVIITKEGNHFLVSLKDQKRLMLL